MTKEEKNYQFGSQLAQFYANKNILLTGATGFLGKLIVQKLFRSCPEIKGIYLIIRQKGNKDPDVRLDAMLKDVVFDALRNDVPDYRKRLHVITGNLEFEGLGLRTCDRKLLIEEINVVLHSAAAVTFQQSLHDAVCTQVRGTKELLDLCAEMKHLVSVMIMSTAYSFCTHGRIGEYFMEPPLKPDTIMKLVADLDEDTLNKITPTLLLNWPNTYTYTKAIMENIVKSRKDQLPIGMYRPSIVISTYKDPLLGWVDNYNGPVGMTIAVGIGMIHVLHVDENARADMIPGDYCVNGFLAATYDVYKKYRQNKNPDNIIYNYVATTKYSKSIKEFCQICVDNYIPYTRILWIIKYVLTQCPVIYYLLAIFTHFLPALFIDGYRLIKGKKPRLFQVYIQIENMRKALQYFLSHEWIMDRDNVEKLWNNMSETDKAIFPFDITTLDWDDYFKNFPKGLLVYVLKDKMDQESRNKATKRYEKFQKLHNILIYVLYIVSAIFAWIFTNWLINYASDTARN